MILRYGFTILVHKTPNVSIFNVQSTQMRGEDGAKKARQSRGFLFF